MPFKGGSVADISFSNLSKIFHVHQKEAGVKASIKALIRRKTREVRALDSVTAQIEKGELVGLVGANGAGKTTLTKILSGVIHPSSGEAQVLGFRPWERHNAYKKQMSLVMGQKNQLWWDLPAADCFLLLKEIYDIPTREFNERQHELAEMLHVTHLLRTQVRRLSLGERMKMELIAALLHQPRVVFLDEPTIGLDITAQRAVRQFLKKYQRECQPVMLLTSHYMQDIAELCERVIVIREGHFVYDGSLKTLQDRYAQTRKIVVQLARPVTQAELGLESETIAFSEDNLEMICHADRSVLSKTVARIFERAPVKDLSVQAEDISTIIERVMQGHE